MSTTNVNATILCTECNHQSTFPKVYLSMDTRKSFTYFCGNCGTVTLHTISQADAGTDASSSSVERFTESASVARDRPNFSSQPVEEVPAEVLWGRLLRALEVSEVPLEDFYRCDDSTRIRMFSPLGFEKKDHDRLLQLSKEKERKQQNSPRVQPSSPAQFEVAAPHTAYSPAPVAEKPQIKGLNNSTGTVGNASNLYGAGHTDMAAALLSANRSGVHYSGWKPSQNNARLVARSNRAPSIPGVYMQGENMLARCTVYPELPAEFWCCACNCLVSSRCHVQGIHKDHPFISMRLAAETYVRDTASWADRCRTQLNITNTVIGNLQHAHGILDQAVNHQFEVLDRNVDQIIKDICVWRDQIKSDVIQQVRSEHLSLEQATLQSQELYQLYSEYLKEAEPLLGNMPPATQQDSTSDDWALKFLDFVSRLKLVNADPVTMPKVLVPEIRCTFSAPMAMDILKHISNPISVRLPDIIDPGYFHYPHPTTSTRTPFALTLPQDGRQKGVVIENNRTLTRAPDTAPSHTLVTGSQIFYSGTTSWEVHIDKVGHGVGRILAGVIIQGSDGEGVVWDGYRIVGPNEGESRTISDKFKIKPGTTLRFVLELDAPHSYLNCFFEKEGVARIPLPPASSGWVPAFSVFGPQDQITVVPTQGAGAMEGAIPKNGGPHPSLANGTQPDLLTRAKLEQQELVIASLQKQLETISSKIEQGGVGGGAVSLRGATPMHVVAEKPSFERAAPSVHAAPSLNTAPSKAAIPAPAAAVPHRLLTENRSPDADGSIPSIQQSKLSAASALPTPNVKAIGTHYSPELAQLLRFVDEIK